MRTLFLLALTSLLYSCGGMIPAVAEESTAAQENIAVESQVIEKLETPRIENSNRHFMFGLGFEGRMRKKLSSESDHENQNYPSVFVSYREKWFQTLGELSTYQDETAASVLRVKYTRQEYRHWVRAMLYPEKTWSPFIGAGLGLYQEKIETGFFADKVTRKSDWELTGGLEAGLHATFFGVIYTGINLRALQDAPEGLFEGSDEVNWSGQFQLGLTL